MKWKATVTYKTTGGTLTDTHEFEEMFELGDYIEGGPSFYSVIDIKIEPADPSNIMTIEQSLEL